MSKRNINKTGFLLGLVILLMAFSAPETNMDEQAKMPAMVENSTCNIENTSFQAGEEIVYKVFYNWNFIWLSAGEVVFKVKDLGDQYHFSAVGRTYKSYEWFYKIRDYYDTYVDKETLLPNVSIRDINEGKYRLYDKITFDQQSQKASSFRGKTKDTAKVTDYDIDACMHDMLSIFYFTRNLNYDKINKGSLIPIKIFADKETWPLEMEFRGKDGYKKIKGMGRFKTIQFGPEVIEGYYFKKDTKMNIWVSDDENKIPLLIESPVSVGSIKVVLKDYKNLRHEFGAKVDKKDKPKKKTKDQ